MFNFRKNSISKYYKNIVKETKQDKQFLYGVNPKYKNQENTLLEMFGRCDSLNKNIKMVVIADTHGCLKEDEFAEFMKAHEDCDVCLLLGDHSVGDVDNILKYVDSEKIYALLGNHDYDYIGKFNLKNLNGQVVEVNGVIVPYCIHGHLHTPYEKEMFNGTKVKCCSMWEWVEI